MRTRLWIVITSLVAMFLFAVVLASAQSLGELARKQRQEKAKESPQPAKVFTNENIPTTGGISVTGAVVAPPAAGPQSSRQGAASEAAGASSSAGGAPPASEAASSASQGAAPSEDKKRDQEYWQGRFKAARAHLADVQRDQELLEGELTLEQTAAAREPDEVKRRERYQAEIDSKTAAVEAHKKLVAKAQEELEKLQKEFDESGAPPEWSKTE